MEAYIFFNTAIDGTYVVQCKEGGFFSKGGLEIHRVPITPKEALASDLMGLFEKNRCRKFLGAIQNFEEGNPKTYDGIQIDQPAAKMFAKYEL
jgi:Rab GDP dissociation inhibitor